MTDSTAPQAIEYSPSRTRAIALIGLFSALYILLAGIAGSMLGTVAQGYPEHFIRGLLMAALVVRTRRMWSATIMGLVSGLVFLAVPSPYPPVFLLISTVISGLVFDLALVAGGSYSNGAQSRFKVLVGSGISGVAESVSLLSLITFGGFASILTTFSGLLKLLTVSTVVGAWSVDIVLNIALSLLGSYIAFAYISPSRRGQRKKMDAADNNPGQKKNTKN